MPKPDKSAERIPQILQAAMQVFTEKGFDAARMQDIADAANLSIGGVYWYYKSKEQVILALMQETVNADLRDLRTRLDAPGTVRERLENFVRANLPLARSVMPLTYELYSLANRDPRVRTHIQSFLAHYHGVLVEFVQQGIDRGEFRAVNPHTAATLLAAAYEGMNELTMLDAPGIEIEKSLAGIFDLLFNGFTASQKIANAITQIHGQGTNWR